MRDLDAEFDTSDVVRYVHLSKPTVAAEPPYEERELEAVLAMLTDEIEQAAGEATSRDAGSNAYRSSDATA